MTYRIEVLPALSAICVTFSEQVTINERANALEDILDTHDALKSRNLLIDMAQANVVEGSHVETLAYAARLARQSAMHAMQVAYVGDGVSGSNMESLAALRGYFYRRFPTRLAALRWMANGPGFAGRRGRGSVIRP